MKQRQSLECRFYSRVIFTGNGCQNSPCKFTHDLALRCEDKIHAFEKAFNEVRLHGANPQATSVPTSQQPQRSVACWQQLNSHCVVMKEPPHEINKLLSDAEVTLKLNKQPPEPVDADAPSPLKAPRVEADDSHVHYIAIDPTETRLHDDAFQIAPRTDGTPGYVLRIAIANFIGTALDQGVLTEKVVARAWDLQRTIYAASVHPVWEAAFYSCTLSQSLPRSAIVLSVPVVCNANGAYKSIGEPKFTVENVRLRHNFTYEEADSLVTAEDDGTNPAMTAMHQAFEIAKLMCRTAKMPMRQFHPTTVNVEKKYRNSNMTFGYELSGGRSRFIIEMFLSFFSRSATLLLPDSELIVRAPRRRLTTDEEERLCEVLVANGYKGTPTKTYAGLRDALSAVGLGFCEVKEALGIDLGMQYVVLNTLPTEEREYSAPTAIFTHPLRSYMCAYHQFLLLEKLKKLVSPIRRFFPETAEQIAACAEKANDRQRASDELEYAQALCVTVTAHNVLPEFCLPVAVMVVDESEQVVRFHPLGLNPPGMPSTLVVELPKSALPPSFQHLRRYSVAHLVAFGTRIPARLSVEGSLIVHRPPPSASPEQLLNAEVAACSVSGQPASAASEEKGALPPSPSRFLSMEELFAAWGSVEYVAPERIPREILPPKVHDAWTAHLAAATPPEASSEPPKQHVAVADTKAAKPKPTPKKAAPPQPAKTNIHENPFALLGKKK